MTFRRRLASGLLTTSVVAAICVGVPAGVAAAANPVVAENQQAGTSAWKLGSLVADDVTQQVKGYASATSVSQNASITFFVSVNPVQTFNLDIYRIGWYGGLGGRLRLHQPGLADRKSTRLNSSHVANSSAVFCLK